jgi:16S rRNA (cytosine1402-N4)-methyltransferase
MDTESPGHFRDAVHQPVLLAEAVAQLLVRPAGIYLDATLGEGGHSAAILEASSPSGRVVGIDLDPRSLASAASRLDHYGPRFIPVHGNYREMGSIAQSVGITRVDGVLMDLGFSSRQVKEPGYGFSFQRDEPLDMRYNPGSHLTAAEVVNSYPEEELAGVIYRYGEERRSRAIARRIVQHRPVASTAQLAALVEAAIGTRGGGPRRGRRLHPATRTFQALRIEVNDELGQLSQGLAAAVQSLAVLGRLVVISYHSLEDRMVKTFLTRESSACICPPEVPVCVCGHQPTVKLVQRRVITPRPDEIQRNPASRSAKLRVAYRLG